MYNINYTWKEAISNTHDLYSSISETSFIPDRIVGIVRGGLIPAVIISGLFGKPMQTLHTSLRDYPNWENYKPKRNDKNVLFVEDIVDSGETFFHIRERIDKEFPNINAKFATLWYNNECKMFRPDFFAIEIAKDSTNSWIIFPWTPQRK